MEIYFTRHGKTEWNLARRFQGMKGDSPLLPTSYEEIARLAEHIADIPFEAIYCSTALRARATAEGIKKELPMDIPLYFTDSLLEMGYGILEGQLIDEMTELYPENIYNMRHHLDLYDPVSFDGESVVDMIERMTSFITKKVQEHNGPILFVGHSSSLTATIRHLIGKSPAEYRSNGGLFNNSLTILETETKELPYSLKKWNDVSFLANTNPEKLF